MIEVRLAKAEEVKEVVKIYDVLRSIPGASWDEYYPTIEHAQRDFDKGGLYVAVETADSQDDSPSSNQGTIVGTLSAVPPDWDEDDELAVALDCWDPRIKNPCDAGRLGVLPNQQGKGIARKLIAYMLEDVKRRGFDGLLFAVSKENPRAIEIYRSLGFDFCGEFNLWDEDMFSCQQYFGEE